MISDSDVPAFYPAEFISAKEYGVKGSTARMLPSRLSNRVLRGKSWAGVRLPHTKNWNGYLASAPAGL